MRFVCAMSAVFFICLATATGCSKKAAIGTVRGKVMIGSEPISSGTILFENREAGVAINAKLGEDGSYEIRTHEWAGLPEGAYTVAVFPGGTMKDGSETPLAGGVLKPPPPSKHKIPEIYHTTKTSPLKAQVKAGDNSPFNFDLSK